MIYASMKHLLPAQIFFAKWDSNATWQMPEDAMELDTLGKGVMDTVKTRNASLELNA